MTVKIQRPIIFNNQCACKYDAQTLGKAMMWYANKPQCSKKTIFMHGKYPAVSIHGEKIHIHRLVGIYLFSSDIVKHSCIHHKDENRLNAMPDNLENILDKIHASGHNKGKTLTTDHKSKIAEAGKKRKGIKLKRKYDIPLEELRCMLGNKQSINKIAKHYGCDWGVIKQRIHENPDLLGG